MAGQCEPEFVRGDQTLTRSKPFGLSQMLWFVIQPPETCRLRDRSSRASLRDNARPELRRGAS